MAICIKLGWLAFARCGTSVDEDESFGVWQLKKLLYFRESLFSHSEYFSFVPETLTAELYTKEVSEEGILADSYCQKKRFSTV